MAINLSMRDIDTVLVLGRMLNFRQAAAHLHLSQSALSTQVLRIEETLGVRLFDRSTRSVRLTAAGQVFLQQAANLQVAFREAIDAVGGIARADQGQVAVAALPSLAARLLPRVLMAYRKAHPGVALKVHDVLSGPAFDLVRGGEVDFALTAADPQQADLHYEALMSDSFILLVPPDHPLARSRAPVRWLETVDAAHVSMVQPSSVRQYTEWAFLQNRVRFQPAFEAEHLATIVAMVECGFGVAALPEIAAHAVAHQGLIERPLIGPVAERSIGLVTARQRSLSPAAQALVELLRGHAPARARRR
ncbi:LysR family transcriptional regulator [Bordetella genomosp. 12]|uniref:LysR family transcriptional regulator n=1 Tax=Bordetella genomosp. 12 TaxID=463035 RepID=A0A261VKC2_9BORD|nr:LysR family transcriptional regulator [Bordetella genomosp. 12]OZI74529.1 LysR family transcriptional regulator [Bordetella genomosp. 12]